MNTPRQKVLATPRDWDEWFAITQGFAQNLKIWDLVDPDKEESMPIEEPTRPGPLSIREGASSYLDLSPTESSALQLMQKDWEYNYR
ncbi:hypothetical protein ACJ73_08114 [Blastomyces percursus]|uniref:Uncharacterized protein n=1 Tax=Blastomyces percursus TaxID=1658174 RepID=A0A1J9QWJ2_9EURO|nr:hypothetical protein ACJ73_08114 [Blastomyces percursus]